MRTNLYNCLRLLLLIVGFSAFENANAVTTFYSRATGNWNSNSTWSTTGFGGSAASRTPGSAAGDIVIISGRTVTFNATPANSITSITIDQSNNTGADSKLTLTTASTTLTCSGLTMSDNNLANHIELELSSSAIMQVNGSVSITRGTSNSQGERLRVYLKNSSRMNVTGNFTYTYGRAANNETDENEIQLDNTARLDVTGTMIITHGNGNGKNNQFDLEMNSTSIMNLGSMTMTLSNSNDGDDMNWDINGGTMTITGALTVTVASSCTSGNGCLFYIDGATVNIGTLTNNQNGGGRGDFTWYLNKNSTATPCSLNITHNLTFFHNGGDDIKLATYNNTTITVGDSLKSTFTGSATNCNLYIDQNGGSMSVSKSAVLNVIASNNYLDWTIDGATTNISAALIINQSGSGRGDVSIKLNNTSTASAAEFNVGTFATLAHSGGDNLDIILNANSTYTTGDDFTINHTASGGDRFFFQMNGSCEADFGGDIFGNLLTGSSTTDQIFFDINSGTFNVSGKMKLTTNATVTSNAVNEVEVDGNSTIFSIDDSLILSHTGGKSYFYGGVNTGSPSINIETLKLDDKQSSTNTTEFRLGNSSIATIYGNTVLSALAAGETYITLNGTSHFKIYGNFIRANTPSRFGRLVSTTTAFVEYVGTAQQTIAGDAGSGGDGFTYGNIKINNTNATIPQVLMTATEGNATVVSGSTITFTLGVVSTSTSGMIVVADGGAATSGNANSYVDGPIKKVGTTAFTFPVGDGNVWARMTMTPVSGYSTTTAFTGQYFFEAPSNRSNVGLGIAFPSNVEYWDLDRTFDVSSDATCNLTLNWELNTRSQISNNADLRVTHYNSATSKWENHGGTGSGGASGSITTTTPLSSFSPMSFGSGAGLNPLPVELTNFSATTHDGKVNLDWTTASEINNDYFLVEKSNDGINFIGFQNVDGFGTSSDIHNYTITDANPYVGTTYYRLKQTDFDGKFEYSNIVTISLDNSDVKITTPAIQLFPNPSSGESITADLNNLNIDLNSKLVVLDLSGKEILNIPTGTSKYITIPAGTLNKGIYLLKVSSSTMNYTDKLIIR